MFWQRDSTASYLLHQNAIHRSLNTLTQKIKSNQIENCIKIIQRKKRVSEIELHGFRFDFISFIVSGMDSPLLKSSSTVMDYKE